MTTTDAAATLVGSGRGGWLTRGLLGPTSEDLLHLAQEQGWRFVEVNLAASRDKQSLMRLLAEQLRLPASFGSNWDAFADALWDVSDDARGAIVRLKGLAHVPPLLSRPLVDILDERTRTGPNPLVVVADPPLPAAVREFSANQGGDDTREAEN